MANLLLTFEFLIFYHSMILRIYVNTSVLTRTLDNTTDAPPSNDLNKISDAQTTGIYQSLLKVSRNYDVSVC